MVQIIQAQPTAQTLRQQAFQQGLDQIGQGVVGFADALNQKTQREQALDVKIAEAMIKDGIKFTPENIAKMKESFAPQQETGFSWIFPGLKNEKKVEKEAKTTDEKPSEAKSTAPATKTTTAPAQPTIGTAIATKVAPTNSVNSNSKNTKQSSAAASNETNDGLVYTDEKMAEIKKAKNQATKEAYDAYQLSLPIEQRDDYLKAVALKKAEVNSTSSPNETQFKSLPKDKQETIEVLSKKNANKISIANQIDAVMRIWDTLSDDQKVYQGRQLLKTLNSPEGADAIGSEEANRLGSNLEFALGNLTNSNPFQLGRDLEGFKEQAMGTSQSLKDAISSNKALIDEAYGRAPSKAISKTQEDELKELEMLRAKKAGIK